MNRILLCVSLLTAALPAAEVEDRMTKSVAASAGGKLTVEAEYGSIEVVPGASDKVEVEVYRKVDAPDKAESERILKDFDLQVTQSGNDVLVKGIFKTGWVPRSDVRGSRHRMCHDDRCLSYGEYLRTHQFKIAVPSEFSAALHTKGGSISVGDLKGSVRGDTSGGSLRFGRVDGPVVGRTSGGSIRLEGGMGTADVRTSGGSIHIGSVTGDVEAHTSGGSVHIEKTTGKVLARTSGGSVTVMETAGPVDASTSGGSVRAYLKEKPKADTRLSTSGGSITVELTNAAAVEVDASASGGRVYSDFHPQQPPEKRGYLKASINGGGPALKLSTSGGNIHIKRSGRVI